MQIDKNQILELLRARGEQGNAEQADQELPAQVDTDQHAGLLQKFGLDPQDHQAHRRWRHRRDARALTFTRGRTTSARSLELPTPTRRPSLQRPRANRRVI